MFNSSNIVPPKPRQRIVMRQVKAPRCWRAAMFFCYLTVIPFPFASNDSSILLDHQPIWLFWFIVSSAIITIILVLMAFFFSVTEKPQAFIEEERDNFPVIY